MGGYLVNSHGIDLWNVLYHTQQPCQQSAAVYQLYTLLHEYPKPWTIRILSCLLIVVFRYIEISSHTGAGFWTKKFKGPASTARILLVREYGVNIADVGIPASSRQVSKIGGAWTTFWQLCASPSRTAPGITRCASLLSQISAWITHCLLTT